MINHKQVILTGEIMNKIQIANKKVGVNIQGYLNNFDEWSEDFVKKMAIRDNIKLYNDHWEVIYYFREYYIQNLVCPTMHNLIIELMSKNIKFHDRKKYEEHIYSLFPKDPIKEICKLAGLPMPQADS
jgi:tRNA 2-thiouridine synthesizing protein E